MSDEPSSADTKERRFNMFWGGQACRFLRVMCCRGGGLIRAPHLIAAAGSWRGDTVDGASAKTFPGCAERGPGLQLSRDTLC